MLAINVSPNSCHSLQFGFLGAQSDDIQMKSNKNKFKFSGESHLGESGKEFLSDEECVKKSHSLLREVHLAIFNEQVDIFMYCCFVVIVGFLCMICTISHFEHCSVGLFLWYFCVQVFNLVNREAFYTSVGVSVTGIRENYLQLSLGQGTSVFLSLVSSGQDDQRVEGAVTDNVENGIVPLDSFDGTKLHGGKQDPLKKKKWQFPNSMSYEIYLQQIFHEHIFGKGNEKPVSSGNRLSGVSGKDGSGLLGHFSMSLAHRIFSSKVLAELENVV